jgi:hypothetical protein
VNYTEITRAYRRSIAYEVHCFNTALPWANRDFHDLVKRYCGETYEAAQGSFYEREAIPGKPSEVLVKAYLPLDRLRHPC